MKKITFSLSIFAGIMCNVFSAHAQKSNEEKFETVVIGEVTVPITYDYKTEIQTFVGNSFRNPKTDQDVLANQVLLDCDDCYFHLNKEGQRVGYNKSDFMKITDTLVPGKKYLVETVRITKKAFKETNYDDLIAYVKSTGGLLSGTQGLFLSYELLGEKLPASDQLIGADVKENFPSIFFEGDTIPYYTVPMIQYFKPSDGRMWGFLGKKYHEPGFLWIDAVPHYSNDLKYLEECTVIVWREKK